MHVRDTRPHPLDEDDLVWFYCYAAGELGQKSAMGSMIDRLEEGRTHTEGVTDESGALLARKVGAATRQKRIAARLARIPSYDEVTLRYTYGPGLSGPQRALYGDLDSAALPISLLVLTARRQGLTQADLLRHAAPPTVPAPDPLPDGATKADRDAAAKAHKRAVRAARAEWEARRTAALAPLRLAATTALEAASIAYTNTRRPDPSAGCERVEG